MLDPFEVVMLTITGIGVTIWIIALALERFERRPKKDQDR
jgi:hypothetical protein